MKALKEKRISLRSLWRRGLVILSLFALVFASCSDSTDNSSSNSGGSSGGAVRVISMEATPPTATQYLGMPVDLTGVTVTVKYSDGTGPKEIKYEDAKSSISAYPRVVTGKYATNDTNNAGRTAFTGMDTVRIYYEENGNIWHDDVKFTKPVLAITRDNTQILSPDPITSVNPDTSELPGTITEPAVFANGLSLTGFPAKPEWYVDSNEFDFTGFTLFATYEDKTVAPIDFQDVTWKIVPDYSLKRPDADGDYYYEGWVYITVGEDIYDWMTETGKMKAPTDYNKGITILGKLDRVYTVKTIEFTEKPALDDFFFWEANTSEAWAGRLGGKAAAIKVTYRGTKDEPKVIPIKDLEDQRLIWSNTNPGYKSKDFYVEPIDYLYLAKGTIPPGAPVGADGKAHLNPNPKIGVYYRGATVTLDIDVFSNYRGIKLNVNGNEISVDDPEDLRDNDIEISYGADEGTLAGLVEVIATYRAYNNNNETTKKLTLKPNTLANKEYDHGIDWSGPYYTTNFYEARREAREAQDAQPDNKKKDVNKPAVLIYYGTDTAVIEDADHLDLRAGQLFGQKVVNRKIVDGPKKVKVLWKLSTK